MLDILSHARIPVLAEVDVLVVGADSPGCCAAFAARESGCYSIVLLERYGFLGGTSTFALDAFYGFFTPGLEARKVVGGIPDRIVDELDAADAMFLRPNTYGSGTGVNYDPERLKLIWDNLLLDAGVQVLHFALLADVETRQDGSLTYAVVSTKNGFFKIGAKRFIDASGDADLCHLAGIDYEKSGDVDPAQTLTTTFRMCNVDLQSSEQSVARRCWKTV
jgi:flavin-dependent dehydrogenase